MCKARTLAHALCQARFYVDTLSDPSAPALEMGYQLLGPGRREGGGARLRWLRLTKPRNPFRSDIAGGGTRVSAIFIDKNSVSCVFASKHCLEHFGVPPSVSEKGYGIRSYGTARAFFASPRQLALGNVDRRSGESFRP